MSESNGHWGESADKYQRVAEAWDRLSRLPDPGANEVLDTFVASKNLDISALVRIGARMLSVNELAYTGRGYIKYRNMVTGDKWAIKGAEYPQLKIVKGREHSGTVIVCEGETDHARLTMLYPEHDIASLPNGVDAIGHEFADQLKDYERVIVATDGDVAGERGYTRLRELRPDALRLVPPGKDWCEHDGDPVPLPSAEVNHWNLGGNLPILIDLDEELPPPTWLMEDLIYDEGVTALAGESGFGKTTVAAWIAGMAMDSGWHVVWIDYEAGPKQTLVRAKALDSGSAASYRERFHYYYAPKGIEPHLPGVAQHAPRTVVVIDSVGKALAQYGLSENDASEVTRWTVHIIDLAKRHGLPVILIDHVGKKAGDENRYGRGSSAKLADADTQFIVERHVEFSQYQQGTVCLRCVKDRLGWIQRKHWYNVGDGNGRLTFTPTDGPTNQDGEIDI